MPTEREKSLTAIIKERKSKIAALEKKGINPFLPFPSEILSHPDYLRENFKKLEGKEFSVAGRMVSFRNHGGLSFANVLYENSQIQLYIKKDLLKAKARNFLSYNDLNLLDLGDIVLCRGRLTKTKKGEISLEAKSLALLSKSLRPQAEKKVGLKNTETKYRRRYLDLVANPEVREIFNKKALFWRATRTFLEKKGFVEVQTPILQLIHGGAEATPFKTHHNALDIDMYLRIAPELYLKRLIVGGFNKVYEIGRVFRNEGIDKEHLQDYTQMEFYWAYANFNDLLDLIKELYSTVVFETFGTYETKRGAKRINWEKSNIKTADYTKEFKKITQIDLLNLEPGRLEKELKSYIKKENLKPGKEKTLNRLIDFIYKNKVRPTFEKPTLVINHPTIISPLSKRDPNNPKISKRVQLVANGVELCNAFDELNDPLDQKERFLEQVGFQKQGDTEAMLFDKDYVEALEYGMPPTVGFGLSERVFSFLIDKPIRDCVFFPIVRPKG
ncbi:MAG: lysine--tRNA ligase [bacterium]